MPPRSNTFQRLVASIHEQLASTWTVVESRMLEDAVTHELREVDVVAETHVAGQRLRMSIECRDRSRRADVNWVEAMAKKHEHLPTEKLILWSSTGFSRSAVQKAAFLNISTISQERAIPVDWKTLARELIGSRVRYLTPKYSPVVDVVSPEGNLVRHKASPEFVLRDLAGAGECSVGGFMHMLMGMPELPTVLLDHAPDGAGEFHGEFSPPSPCCLLTPEGVELGVVRRLLVGIRTHVEQADLEIRTANYEGRIYSLAEASLSTGRFEVRIAERQGEPPAVKAIFHKDEGAG